MTVRMQSISAHSILGGVLAVLLHGALPLDMLETIINEYIRVKTDTAQ